MIWQILWMEYWSLFYFKTKPFQGTASTWFLGNRIRIYCIKALINKKRYKKEQEENRLKEIAKLLKKQAKKKK